MELKLTNIINIITFLSILNIKKAPPSPFYGNRSAFLKQTYFFFFLAFFFGFLQLPQLILPSLFRVMGFNYEIVHIIFGH